MPFPTAGRRLLLFASAVRAVVNLYRRDRDLRKIAGKIAGKLRGEGFRGVGSQVAALSELDAVFRKVNLQSTIETYVPPSYETWLSRYDVLAEPRMRAAQAHFGRARLPEILILLVVTRAALDRLDAILASWRSSIHAGWTAGLLASADLSDHDRATLETAARDDGRLVVLRSEGDMRSLAGRFPFALICFGSVRLNPLSLVMFVEAGADADVVYSDHDFVDASGRRTAPDFKPQFSPYYLQRYNYVGDCVLVARPGELPEDAIRTLLAPTQERYDRLVDRLTRGRRVAHLPFVLFHALDRTERQRHSEPDFEDRGPRVAIVIPTRDGVSYLRPCLEGILQRTRYDPGLVEIVVIDNESSDPETLDYLRLVAERPNVRVIPYRAPFNFAEINNLGARETRGEILVFLNNDTDVFDPGWLSKLVWYARQPDVGAVGAKLLFPDGRIQHGGCVVGVEAAALRHRLLDVESDTVSLTDHTREMSAVTGACLAIRRTVFDEVGGFDPALQITWNDVKLCLDCLKAGYRNIYVADPLFHHDESRTRGPDDAARHRERYVREALCVRERFPNAFQDDPAYSPNLSAERLDRLSEPPRVLLPWREAPGRPRRILLVGTPQPDAPGVAVVMRQQAKRVVDLGYEVIVGSPGGGRDASYPGCDRVELGTARDAASYAFETDVALIVCHTAPFFEIPNLIGRHIKTVACDHDTPPPDSCLEPLRSQLIDLERQKRFAAPLTTARIAIPGTVADEDDPESHLSRFAALVEELLPRPAGGDAARGVTGPR